MKVRLKIEKRMEGFSGNAAFARIVSLVAAVIITILVLLITGYEAEKIPDVLNALFIDTLFTGAGILETLVKAIPLILCSVGVAIAFRMKLWNIGGEGQFAMGAFAAAGIAMAFPSLPPVLLIILMIVGGILAGMVWALIAGIPRALLGVNETIITLMLNYIALFWLQFLVVGPWKDPEKMGFAIAPEISENGMLPALGGSNVHIGLFIALIITVLYYFVLQRSKWGFEVRAIGDGPRAAQYAGMNVKWNIIAVMAVSGAIVGMGGAIELSGLSHRLEPEMSAGYGFTAVIIAWLARLKPAAIIVMSVFMAAIAVGGKYLPIFGLPASVSEMIQGIILFCVLGFDLLTRYSIKIVRKEAK